MEAASPESPFEFELNAIEAALETQFRVRADANLIENIGGLRYLAGMNKSQMEGFLSRMMIISLNDEEYARLQAKINGLLESNLDAARSQGLEVEE